jgi:hypothetical protein
MFAAGHGAGFPSQRKNWQLLAYLLHERSVRQPALVKCLLAS